MQVQQARSTEDVLHLGAPIVVAKHAQELDLAIGARGKVRVSTLRRNRSQPSVDADEKRLPEPGSGRDDRGVTVRSGHSVLEHRKLIRVQDLGARGHGLEVVQQADAPRAEAQGHLRGADVPCDVREPRDVADNRSRDAGHSGFDGERAVHITRERVEDFG